MTPHVGWCDCLLWTGVLPHVVYCVSILVFSSSLFFLIRFKGRFDLSVCCLREHRVWMTHTSTYPESCYRCFPLTLHSGKCMNLLWEYKT